MKRIALAAVILVMFALWPLMASTSGPIGNFVWRTWMAQAIGWME